MNPTLEKEVNAVLSSVSNVLTKSVVNPEKRKALSESFEQEVVKELPATLTSLFVGNHGDHHRAFSADQRKQLHSRLLKGKTPVEPVDDAVLEQLHTLQDQQVSSLWTDVVVGLRKTVPQRITDRVQEVTDMEQDRLELCSGEVDVSGLLPPVQTGRKQLAAISTCLSEGVNVNRDLKEVARRVENIMEIKQRVLENTMNTNTTMNLSNRSSGSRQSTGSYAKHTSSSSAKHTSKSSVTKSSSKSTSKPTSKSTSKPQSKSTFKPTPKSTPKPTPKSTPKPTPKLTPRPTPKSTPKPEKNMTGGSASKKKCVRSSDGPKAKETVFKSPHPVHLVGGSRAEEAVSNSPVRSSDRFRAKQVVSNSSIRSASASSAKKAVSNSPHLARSVGGSRTKETVSNSPVRSSDRFRAKIPVSNSSVRSAGGSKAKVTVSNTSCPGMSGVGTRRSSNLNLTPDQNKHPSPMLISPNELRSLSGPRPGIDTRSPLMRSTRSFMMSPAENTRARKKVL